MKNKLILLLFVLFLFVPFKASAITYGTVNHWNGVYVRSAADASSSYYGLLTEGEQVTLESKTIYPDLSPSASCPNGWYRVNYNSNIGYICSTYLSVTESTEKSYTAKVDCASYISVWDRTIKDWDFYRANLLDKLITGTYITIMEELPTTINDGCGQIWYKIKYANSKIGYVCSNDARKIEELTLSAENYTEEEQAYATSLLNSGFPESYIPYLMKLKRNYHAWDFKPYKSNLNWTSVISGERNMNKIEGITTSYLPYYASSLVGTEGGDWYYTNDATNAYFIDPRNFLSERFIFMFEELSYNSSYHTPELITSFLTGTWLNNDTIKSNLLTASITYNISPLHLISRILKEGGGSASYQPVTGRYDYNGNLLPEGQTGFYNFYNIGAYSGWGQGLCYAAGHSYSDGVCNIKNSTTYARPWTSIEAALIGGAEFIYKEYLYGGQDTLYYQKFNTKVLPYYSGQYMTNIMAPSQEAETVYKKLKNYGVLDLPYTFVIPVYENMPNIVSLPLVASSDNSLKEIKINGQSIDGFDPDVVEIPIYYVKDTISSIVIDAVASSTGATISGNGNINLSNIETQIPIIVTAENGDTKTYNLVIKKVSGVKTVEEITSALSVKINGNNMGISPSTDLGSLINSIKKADPTSNVVYTSSSDDTFTLKTGDSLKITSSNNETVTFAVIINGDTSGDGKVTILDLLRVQKHILGSSRLASNYYTAADTNSDNKVDILDLLRVQKYILGAISL